jgi:hypothetical protein
MTLLESRINRSFSYSVDQFIDQFIDRCNYYWRCSVDIG